jgi:competence protein ComEA
VQDAVDAAGGLRHEADPAELNLAQLLVDGQQVVIGTERKPTGEVRGNGGAPEAGAAGSGGAGTSAGPPGSGAALDLNRATAAELEDLPGVGPVTAAKIASWREQHGRFSRVEELQEVDGIGPKTYAEIAPHVRV